MQTVDLAKYPNTSGWQVIQNPSTNLFEIKNPKGKTLKGMYTTRVFAERGLDQYLERVTKNAPKNARP